jgi:hypothetical protein
MNAIQKKGENRRDVEGIGVLVHKWGFPAERSKILRVRELFRL